MSTILYFRKFINSKLSSVNVTLSSYVDVVVMLVFVDSP